MGVHFLWLGFASLIGMMAIMITGWDPWKLVGVLIFVVLFSPIVQIGLVQDQVEQQNLVNAYIENLISALPSLIIGHIAGVVAGTILGFFADLGRGLR